MKTVTFSEHEGDLSDNSSICHSPSWEGFRQNNKKSKKKKERTPSKRLSKTPPRQKEDPSPRQISSHDRSLSAPEFNLRQKLHERTSSRSKAQYPPNSMANPHNVLKNTSTEDLGKTKPKGFLSGFRLQHSNVAAVQKMAAPPRPSTEDSDMARSGLSFPLQNQGPSRGEMDFLNPRKAPSIKSTQSASTLSVSSRSGGGHSRSSSLLSKLKGPSYLYAQPSEPTESIVSQRSNGSEQVSPLLEQPVAAQNPSPQPFVLDHAPISKHPETRPARGRDVLEMASQLRTSSDYEDEDVPEFRGTKSKEHGHAKIISVATERRRRPHADTEQPASHEPRRVTLQDNPPAQANEFMRESRTRTHETQRAFPHVQESSRPMRPRVAIVEQNTPMEGTSPRKDYASQYTEEVDRLSVTHSPHDEVDKTFFGTRKPSSRSGSQERLYTPRNQPAFHMPKPSVGSGTFYYNRVEEEVEEEVEESDQTSDAHTDESVREDTNEPVVGKRDQPADYFAFISESYAPPVLALRSPSKDTLAHAVRIQEEPGEEDDDPDWTILPIQSPSSSTESSADGFSKSGLNHMASRRKVIPFEMQASPALSANQSDSDVPAFEHLMTPHAVDQNNGKAKPSMVPFEGQPSRSTSERSSSSTSDDAPPSSAATTPDGSRPQSQRGRATEIPRSVPSISKLGIHEQSHRKFHDSPVRLSSRSSSRDTRRSPAVSVDNLKDSIPTVLAVTDPEGLVSSPSLISAPASSDSIEFSEVAKEKLEKLKESRPAPTRRQTLPPPKATSASDSTATDFLPPLKHQPLHPRGHKAGAASTSLPNSPPPELETSTSTPLRPALKTSRNHSSSSQDSSNAPSAGAVYLKEARKSVPVLPSSRALRPFSMMKPTAVTPSKGGVPGEKRGEPIAKMLVECCSCKFLHDMPSRVYECMAKPDSFVEDKMLGVSAAITTMVKCPWCAHGMTTDCCSGYAAMIYLKEKLHGK